MPAAGARRRRTKTPAPPAYVLDTQVGFLLRQVMQRHTIIFGARMGEELTSTQWAALAKLAEKGPCSQNLLGRLTAMDAATIKGVVDRLVKRALVETRPDPEDGRRLVVALTAEGVALAERAAPTALGITEETLAPLDAAERAQLLALLSRLK
ncbi:MarR family winged helix-turn-helix transcriptional regulator [Azorhizobium doebereinerae]|uniref:MarR family winged helix-turn-helix transcriptional regulator n=1 Tax=Azorhizobium doebereinerae TaxID=281091 RepID=UPI000686647D|nr:MarR family transcriptional regulator [Azorhizobium doebereinerae]